MNRKASILPFGAEHQASPLEGVLKELEDPKYASPGLLFQDPDAVARALWGSPGDEDLLFLEDGYFFIDGSEGAIDVLVSREKTSLAALLAGGDAERPAMCGRDKGAPLVRDVEVLLTGDIALTRRSELPALGIFLEGGNLSLDGRWQRTAARQPGAPHATETWLWLEGGLRLETTLAARRTPEQGGGAGVPLSGPQPEGKRHA